MNIISLEIQNVGKIKAVKIVPKGSVVTVGGKNDQGKSTVLKSIAFALCGQKELWAKAVREGEERGKIIVDLLDYVATLSIPKDGGSTLTLRGKDGSKIGSPQSVLNKLAGGLSFDPLRFTKLEPEKQAEQVRKLVGVDFTELNVKRKKLYDERTAVGRDETNLRGQINGITRFPEAPEEEVSISDLLNQQKEANDNNALNDKQRGALADLKDKKADVTEEIASLEKQLAEKREALKTLDARISKGEMMVAALEDTDVDSIQTQIENAEETNRKVRANKSYNEKVKEADSKSSEYSRLGSEIDKIDEEKMKQLKEARFPLEGLSFDESGITFDGIPFEQCSGAQQLKISFAIWIAMNPTLRVVLIDNGEALDDENLATIHDMAVKNDVQVWIVRIGSGEEVDIVIHDGEVKEVR